LFASGNTSHQCGSVSVEAGADVDLHSDRLRDSNFWRQIFLDGREMAEDAPPSWFGYSTGKWDGDTLVVDTKGFNGKAWIDQLGKPATEALHVIERFRRKDFGHMDIQVSIDDPKAYTKPWTITEPAKLSAAVELMEFICNENNRDLEHLPGRP